MMTEQDFDLKLRHIEEQYQAKSETVRAYHDQELARLFGECGWDQECIRERFFKVMGRRISQPYVSQRLKFGAFLNYIASCNKSDLAVNLTEGRFRQHWTCTKGTDAGRFAAVADRIENGIPQGAEALSDKPGIARAVREVLADGKWYTTEQILATAEESLPGLTRTQVLDSLRTIRRNPAPGKKLETRHFGTRAQYRFVKEHSGKGSKMPPAIIELCEKAAPLLDELDELAGMSMARLSPGLVRQVAFRLRKLFDSLTAEATA